MNQTFIYVSCAGSREIDVFALDIRSGEAVLCQRLVTEDSPLPLKISPAGGVLYVGTRLENALLACSINPDSGELALLGRVPSPGAPVYVSCDRSMRMAFVASYGDNLLASFPLDAQGAPLSSDLVQGELPRAHAAVVDATNRWLLVPMLGADAIRIYRFDAGVAKIVPNKPSMANVRPGSGPRHLVFSPDNRHVHCLNELDGSIDLFDFDAERGTLELKQSVSMMPHGFDGQPWAAELRVTPNGRFLYATDRRSSVLAVFSVDAQNGQLALFGHYPTETQPRGMAIDPSGHWLAVAGQLSGHLAIYELDQETGFPRQRFRHATGQDPICIEMGAVSNVVVATGVTHA